MQKKYMDVYAMKREVLVCDNCKNAMAIGKCDVCGHDICKSVRCKKDCELYFPSIRQSGRKIAMFSFCVKCDRTLTWQGDLSPDLKDIILDRIKARRILNVVEKDN